jgi:hypothetical protein
VQHPPVVRQQAVRLLCRHGPDASPLGILTGVGFIGGGAILKKGGSITGVTTAATLWIATVIGLCLGGGQLGLGALSTALGIFTLWGMHWIDARVRREHTRILVVATEPGSPKPSLDDLLRPQGYRAALSSAEPGVWLRQQGGNRNAFCSVVAAGRMRQSLTRFSQAGGGS